MDLDDGRMQTLFKQGQAAHYLGFSGFALNLSDPEESQVAGNVCYAKYPSGPTGAVPMMGVGLSMSDESEHKEAGVVLPSVGHERGDAAETAG